MKSTLTRELIRMDESCDPLSVELTPSLVPPLAWDDQFDGVFTPVTPAELARLRENVPPIQL